MRRLLILGCGDVAMRMVPLVRGRCRIYALSHSPQRFAALRAAGITPVFGDLDNLETLGVLAGLAHDVVHMAPPPSRGPADTRTAHAIAALAKGKSLPQHLVYISTSGVYGDCNGDFVDETRPVRPRSARALRRVDAEAKLRDWGARSGVRVSILRAPGIYAADRLPLERLARGTPALAPAEDTFVNHVHADDLARLTVAALYRGLANRSYNATDDEPQRMGDYFDLVADAFGLPRPPRAPRAEVEAAVTPAALDFMRESRRLGNRRIKDELRFRLRYPTVRDGVASAAPARTPAAHG